ncbi:hypothetical protein DWG14_00188 [Streptomyces griseorubiginosus]|uniref:alpha-L-rhamnosidase n=2 Tax=Streptomyces griseorubiginosus TaxID=67304 RepID=A0AAI8KUK0_9ACTN|nr:hypothetical protein DWG14_00188 [Streptomyces griseorubiginosus]
MHWRARMIAPDGPLDASPILFKDVELAGGHGSVVSASLHASALGIFEARLNGVSVGPDLMSPGWSAYQWRLRYRSYDVTDRLDQSTRLTLSLGNGWFHGTLGWEGQRHSYGTRLGAIAQLEVMFEDGHQQLIATDRSWSACASDVLENDLYNGQTIDARLRRPEWATPGVCVPNQTGVEEIDFDTGRLAPYVGPPIVRREIVRPRQLTRRPDDGAVIVDFGQNLVGWTRFRVRGEPGRAITVRHAEVLDGDQLNVRPLRSARATDRFVLSGEDDSFEPTMTYHGFRFAEVSNWPGELTPDSIEAVVVHSDLSRIGHFRCSDPDLNQLHSNVVWSTKGNFFDVPTDCPQRDERLGWTGDIAVFAPTAAFLFDVQDFLEDWLIDLGLEQEHRDGLVPMVVPDPLKEWPIPPGQFSEPDSTAIWSDAAVWVPWALFWAYGDSGVLARHYDSMAAHLRHVEGLLSTDGTWSEGFQFGDWLDPLADPHEPWNARADAAVVATACLYRTSTILTQAATILGRAEDATAFLALAERTRAAFHAAYVTDEGTITSDAPTVYALAITFGLLEGQLLERAGERLARLVREADHHVSTGFAGTPFISDALTRTGHLGDAYHMLLKRDCPSWLYPVSLGATTIWERWDSMLPDGSVNPGEMTSFNHYALGAIADWMHRTIGGITPLEPGYGHVLIAPQPGGALTWADCALETRSGRISVRWRRETELALDIELPPGVSAVVRVTGHPDLHLSAGPDGLQHTARFSADRAANETSSAPGVPDATR